MGAAEGEETLERVGETPKEAKSEIPRSRRLNIYLPGQREAARSPQALHRTVAIAEYL